MPLSLGVPLNTITLDDHAAVTPAGSPLVVPIPVAPLVAWVICVIAVWIHTIGEEEAALTVFAGTTCTDLAAIVTHPLLSVTVTT